MCLFGHFLPCSSRLPVLLPCPLAGPSGRSHPHLAAGGCVWWIGQHHVGGVPKGQRHSGALRRVYVHSSRLMVLPGRCQMSKLCSEFRNPRRTQCQRTFTSLMSKEEISDGRIWLFLTVQSSLKQTGCN